MDIKKTIRIDDTVYEAVKEKHENCMGCDIFKHSKINSPHHYPLCYEYDMKGKWTDSGRGVIVNWCASHPIYIWKKVTQ